MAVRLKDRNSQIPGGLKFYVPQTKWSPFPFSSFDTIVRQLIDHRRINHRFASQLSWSTDYATVANEVDRYNAEICKSQGWTSYYVEDATGQPPKTKARSLLNVLGNLAAGGEILTDWLGAGGVPVPAELASKRAAVCVRGAPGEQMCPKNSRGDWTRFFTIPASNKIRAMLSKQHDMALQTPYDDRLGVCLACDCPLKLKVWTPLSHIKEHTSAQTKAEFPSFCWILKELNGEAA